MQNNIRKNMLVLMSMLQELKYKDNTSSVEKFVSPRIVPASREKMYDDFVAKRNNSSNLSISDVLPAISIMFESTTYAPEYKIQHLQTMIHSGGTSYSPVPYAITYHGIIFTEKLSTALQLIEQLQEVFDPYLTVPIKYEDDTPVINTPFLFQTGSLTTDLDFDVNTKRTLSYDFTISSYYVLYKRKVPEFDSKLIVEYNNEVFIELAKNFSM